MRALGAELIVHGEDFDAAREHCEQLAAEHGYRYIHSGQRAAPDRRRRNRDARDHRGPARRRRDHRPIGGGSGAAGACIVAKAIRPEIQVIGVQSEAAPAAFRSWQARALVEGENATFAEGLATRVPFELPQQILWEHLDDFVLVTEDEIRQREPADDRAHAQPRRAGRRRAARRRAEAPRPPARQAGRACASGGNISPAQLAALFS